MGALQAADPWLPQYQQLAVFSHFTGLCSVAGNCFRSESYHHSGCTVKFAMTISFSYVEPMDYCCPGWEFEMFGGSLMRQCVVIQIPVDLTR